MKSSYYIFLISILATISVYGEPSEEDDYNESEIESCTHVVPIDNDFWWFITDSLPKITSQKEITIRLVYSFGDVYLRSEEFDWILKANDVKVKK